MLPFSATEGSHYLLLGQKSGENRIPYRDRGIFGAASQGFAGWQPGGCEARFSRQATAANGSNDTAALRGFRTSPVLKVELEKSPEKLKTSMLSQFLPNTHQLFGINGGDDGARTRDLCRDRV